MNIYPVTVECPPGRGKAARILSRKGLMASGFGLMSGLVDEKCFGKIRDYCEKQHLKYHIDNGFGVRSQDYRRKFFRANKPHIAGMYFCAYCGRLRTKRYITVDHLYPVSMADRSIALQKKLKKHGIRNVNDVDNLVPACARCNKLKSNKMGVWITKGLIGRFPEVWIVRHVLRITAIAIITGLLVKFGIPGVLSSVITIFKMAVTRIVGI